MNDSSGLAKNEPWSLTLEQRPVFGANYYDWKWPTLEQPPPAGVGWNDNYPKGKE